MPLLIALAHWFRQWISAPQTDATCQNGVKGCDGTQCDGTQCDDCLTDWQI